MCTCRGPVRYCNLYHGFWNHIQFVSGLYQMDGLNNLKLLHVKRRYLRILLITKNAVWYTISTISKVCSKRNNIFGIYIYVTHFFTIYHYFLIHSLQYPLKTSENRSFSDNLFIPANWKYFQETTHFTHISFFTRFLRKTTILFLF